MKNVYQKKNTKLCTIRVRFLKDRVGEYKDGGEREILITIKDKRNTDTKRGGGTRSNAKSARGG